MPVHSHDGRRQAEAVVQPETRAAAKLDREGPGFPAGVLAQARIEVGLEIDIPHAALKPRLPPDAQIAQRLRVANFAGTAEFRNAYVEVAIAASGRVIRAIPEAIVTAEDGRRFDAIGDSASDLIGLGGRYLGPGEAGERARHDQPYRGAGVQA